MMIESRCVLPAKYQPTGVSRYDGNPLIEALPKYPLRKSSLLNCTANYPERPTRKMRAAPEMVRIAEARTLNDLRVPIPELLRSSVALTLAIRESYVPRNPLTILNVKRRHAMALARDEHTFHAATKMVKSKAIGHSIVAITGMGKTTYIYAFTDLYPQVIQHTRFQETPLVSVQITWLILRCPHDGTLRSLCYLFFAEIDKRLGTEYLKQAMRIGGIAPMVMMMQDVAEKVSLGLLIIDELQNLRAAHGATAEVMLSLFSDIIETVGVSLVVLATPAVQSVIETVARNIRKLTTGGDAVVYPLHYKDQQWKTFTEICWEYTYTKHHGQLTSDIQKAWWEASGGNYGFATTAFFLAQLDEIGNDERIAEVSFEAVAMNQMSFLKPAIDALKSGKPADLLRFDDLLLQRPYDDLQRLLGKDIDAEYELPVDLFEEEAEVEAGATKKSSVKRAPGKPTAAVESAPKKSSTTKTGRGSNAFRFPRVNPLKE